MASQPLFEDNLDSTKIVGLDAAGITAGTTRTIVMPDTDCTLFDSADLGTFSGDTISDNTDILSALQELETEVERRVDPDATRTYTKAAKAPYLALTDTGAGTTITLDLNESNAFNMTITNSGTRILALINATAGQRFMIRITQPSTGDGLITWWSGVNWAENTEPTLSVIGDASDSFGFLCTGTNEYDGYILGQNIPG